MNTHILISSYRSEVGTVHLMLKEPSGWENTWTSLEPGNVTLLEVHTGLSTIRSRDQNSKWHSCLMQLLDRDSPQVLRLHREIDGQKIPKTVVSDANKKSYFIENRGNTWTLWSE